MPSKKSKSTSKLIIGAFIGLVSLSVMVKAEFQVDIGFRIETKSNTVPSLSTPQAANEQNIVQSYSLWAKTSARSELEMEKESQ
jgi:hypothetical protein